MTYQTQPGTLPHRVVEFLKAKPAGFEISTSELCDALGLENWQTGGFTGWMRPAREGGALHAEMRRPGFGRPQMFWRLGDGRPRVIDTDVTRYDAAIDAQGKPGRPKRASFNALLWEGSLLATGMEIRDGVAIFTPEQAMQLRRQLAWAPAP